MSAGDVTLRELDEAAGVPKGSAFRAFKRHLPQLREGVDFRVLSDDNDPESVAALQRSQRAYRSSRRVVLLSAALAERLRRELQGP